MPYTDGEVFAISARVLNSGRSFFTLLAIDPAKIYKSKWSLLKPLLPIFHTINLIYEAQFYLFVGLNSSKTAGRTSIKHDTIDHLLGVSGIRRLVTS